MNSTEFDYWEFMDETEAKFTDIRRQDAQVYLAIHGDVIQTRIIYLFRLADRLYKNQFFGPALVFAVTAIDVMVQYVFVAAFSRPPSPLVDAEDHVRVTVRSSFSQRHYLPQLLRQEGVSTNLLDVRLANGKLLWATIIERVWPKRNRVVHKGEFATATESITAMLCAKTLWDDVVMSLSKELGLTVKTTHRWHLVQQPGDQLKVFEKKNPF